tara:strand:- start:324 stop:518 length:195 start_codon:yes stop_codon:yes gene_type:complete
MDEDRNLKEIVVGCVAYTAFGNGCVMSEVYSGNDYLTYSLGLLALVSVIPVVRGIIREGRRESN